MSIIVKKILAINPKNERELVKAKNKIAKEMKVSVLTNRNLLAFYRKAVANQQVLPNLLLERLLVKRKVRTLSGVAPLTVSTKPYPCPGKCIYCPSEEGMPKSYLKSQPAASRAYRLRFDPYEQIQKRLEAFYENGHEPTKIDLRVIGGTWSFYPRQYQMWFVKRLFQAMNQYKFKIQNAKYKVKVADFLQKSQHSLEDLQKRNEKAVHRCVSFSIETRPDFVTIDEIKRLRKFGVTKVELGVQSVDDGVLKNVRRGHDVSCTIYATKLLKDAGLKISYHMMPGLFGSTPEKDFHDFKKLFADENFQPDYLKIYPCVVLKNSRLYKLFESGKFQPYDTKTLRVLLLRMKKIVPRYVRIERIFRDIPAKFIAGGSDITNFRQLLHQEMKKEGLSCRCIRCREIRAASIKEQPKFFCDVYRASGGTEYFLSFESKDRKILFAFLRLRIPEKLKVAPFQKVEPLKHSALIREVHTYGQLLPVGEKNLKASQHRGLGRRLIRRAEKIAKDCGYQKITVISGVGVRDYYRKLRYRLSSYGYMTKKLTY